MKQVQWLADARTRVRAFPPGVQDGVGYSLFLAQTGKTSQNIKPLHGLGSGVMEISEWDVSGTYRVVFTVSIGECIYVIHAFQKKSSDGIATPKRELDLVRRRLQLLRGEVTDGKK